MKKISVSNTQHHKHSQYIKGRLFAFKHSQWLDQTSKSRMKKIKVRYLSTMYFKLLRFRPDLRVFFALGHRVSVVLNKKYVVVIGTTESPISDAKIRSISKQ